MLYQANRLTNKRVPGFERLESKLVLAGNVIGDLLAYGGNFRGGVHVAVADFNTDGVPDVVTGAGSGGTPHLRLWDGATLKEMFGFDDAYPRNFRGGVHVAVGDFNRDGTPDIVTGAGPGGGSHVRVWDGKAMTDGQRRELFGIPEAYPGHSGGVHVAAADFNRDGIADIVTGAGGGGGHRSDSLQVG